MMAQIATGDVLGTVTDASGAAVPNQSSSVSANGQYELVNNNLIDGLDNNEAL